MTSGNNILSGMVKECRLCYSSKFKTKWEEYFVRNVLFISP